MNIDEGRERGLAGSRIEKVGGSLIESDLLACLPIPRFLPSDPPPPHIKGQPQSFSCCRRGVPQIMAAFEISFCLSRQPVDSQQLTKLCVSVLGTLNLIGYGGFPGVISYSQDNLHLWS